MSVIYDNAKLRKNCKSKPAAAKNLALKENMVENREIFCHNLRPRERRYYQAEIFAFPQTNFPFLPAPAGIHRVKSAKAVYSLSCS